MRRIEITVEQLIYFMVAIMVLLTVLVAGLSGRVCA